MLADRHADLVLLEDAVRATARGTGALLVISGPVGIGKTALLDAVATTAAQHGAQVLRATASVVERQFPLGVARQLCDSAVAGMSEEERAKIVEGIEEAAQPVFPADEDAEQTALRAAHHLLDVAGDRNPVVLLVDDLQWVDDESLRSLGYLANRLAGAPVLLVLTVRETAENDGNSRMRELVGTAARVLRPQPLSATGIASVVRAMFGEDGSESFLRACSVVSRGNPLLLRAVLGEVVAETGRPGDESVELVRTCRPAMLRDRMVARLRGQPEPAMAFLRSLSCVGTSVGHELVGRLAELDAIGSAEVARSLTGQGFLTSDPEPGFVHPVVREAVEKLTQTAELERLHVTAATLLHAEGHEAEEVAGHLLAVPSAQQEWAVEVLREAAGLAAERGDTDAAARYLRRALLDTEPASVGRVDLLLDLATVEGVVDPSASVRHVLEAVSLSEAGLSRAAALVRLSPLTIGMGPISVLSVVREAASALGDGEHLTGAERELALRLEARVRAGDPASARRIDEAVQRLRALDQTRCLRSPAGRELLAVLLEIAAISGAVPSQEVAQLGHRLLEFEPATTNTNAAVPMVVSALTIADQAAPATPWLEAALERAVRRRDVVARATVELARALVLMGAGRIGAGACAAMASTAAIGDRWFDVATVAGVLRMATVFELYVPESWREGDAPPDLSERIVQVCGHRTDHPVVVALTRLTAARAAAAHDPRLALEHLQDSGRQLDRAGWRNPAVVPWRTSAATLHHQLGNEAVALGLAEDEYELAVGWGSPAAVGRALRLRGALTAGDEGVRLLREAVAVLETSENRLEQARAHLLLGNRLARSGAQDAEEHLRQGRSLAEAGVPRAMAEREAQSFGIRPDPSFGGLLTPAERRVVAIALDGRTNQAIADELGVTRRAVEKHLSSAYLKLNVTGRAELRERLVG